MGSSRQSGGGVKSGREGAMVGVGGEVKCLRVDGGLKKRWGDASELGVGWE